MKERTWSRKLDGFEENEMERGILGCCVCAYKVEWDGEGARFGRGRETLNVGGAERV